MKKLIIITLMLASSVAVYADYHYASHDGSNEYPYTGWETAALLIQDAVDAASPHDTVYIGAGEWIEEVLCEFYDSVAIIGMGWDSTYWHTDAYRTPAIYLGEACLVDNIKFRHPTWRSVDNLMGGPSTTITNCKFVDSHWGAHINGGTTEVSHCLFDNCEQAVGVYDYSGHFIVSNNLILNTTGHWAIHLISMSSVIQNNIIIPGSVTSISTGYHEGGNNLVSNNAIFGGNTGIATLNSIKHNNSITLQTRSGMIANINEVHINNSITNCDHGIDIIDENIVINYNNFWNNQLDIDNWGHSFDSVGNIFSDPMFVSDTDVHLQAFSPLIDTGDPNVFDVDGSRSDIGAYGGPYGCSYTYLDLAPQIPDSITVDLDTNSVILNWPMNTESDFNRYQIFRDTVPGFEPTIFDIISEPDTSFYADTNIEPGVPYYYRLTSVDNQGNVSDYSDEVAVIPTYVPGFIDDGLPKYTVIESVYPNPSNSNVTIVYSASNLGPQPPMIELKIFDIQGRVVKTLIDERKPMGTYRAVWDGTNNNNQPVASGNYIAKISQWGMDAGDFPVKITLIK